MYIFRNNVFIYVCRHIRPANASFVWRNPTYKHLWATSSSSSSSTSRGGRGSASASSTSGSGNSKKKSNKDDAIFEANFWRP